MATIQQYRNMVRINRHRLDDELEMNAQIMEEIGQQAGAAERRATALKLEYEQVAARLVRNIKANDPKATAVLLESEITLDRACCTAQYAHADAQQIAAEWSALAKAWYQRGFDMKALSELFVAQYFVIDSTGRAERKPEIDQAARAAMRSASSSVSQFSRIAEAQERDAAATVPEVAAPRRRRVEE